MDRIVVAFANTEAQHRIVHLLEPNGYGIACVCTTGAEVIRTVRKLGTASVVCGFKLRDMTATELAASLRGAAALLVVSSPVHLDLCEGENLFKLVTPSPKSDFFASMEMLLELEEKQLRPPVMQRIADEKRSIERAKTLLMEINRMTESEAHRFLQKRSMDTGMRMVETAQFIIDSYSHGQ